MRGDEAGSGWRQRRLRVRVSGMHLRGSLPAVCMQLLPGADAGFAAANQPDRKVPRYTLRARTWNTLV